MSKTEHRRTDLDIAKALAITLVVFHHALQYLSEHAGNVIEQSTLQPALLAMNGVHITAFMLVAGMTSAISERRRAGSLAIYPGGIISRMRRLGVPLLFIAAITLGLKVAIGSGLGPELSTEAINTILTPRLGVASHLWFIHALLLISLIFPMLCHITPNRMLWILPIGLIALAVTPISIPTREGYAPWFGMNDVLWFFPLYAIGYVLVRHEVNMRRKHRAALLMICASAFALSLTAMLISDIASLLHDLGIHRSVRWINGFCGATGLLMTAMILRRFNAMHRFGKTVGRRSYEVYLLHAIVGQLLVVLVAPGIGGKLSAAGYIALIVPAAMVGSLMIGIAARKTRLGKFLLLGRPIGEKQSPVRVWKNGAERSLRTAR